MNQKRSFLGVVIGLMLASLVSGQGSVPPGKANVGPTAPVAAEPSLSPKPRIWMDEEATEIARLVAGPHVNITVLRWENAYLEGWAQFDDSPDRIPLDFSRAHITQLQLRGIEDNQLPAANRLSGMAIVSQTKVEKAEGYDWWDCQIIIKTSLASAKGADQDEKKSNSKNQIRGRLKLRQLIEKKDSDNDGNVSEAETQAYIESLMTSGEQGSDTRWEFYKYLVDEKNTQEWMQLRVLSRLTEPACAEIWHVP